ncbi:MAG: hypothetical protein ABEJ26_04135 [Halosimplex sp.]
MSELLFEPVAESLGMVLYALVAGALTVVGALAENAGFNNLTAGQTMIGAWEGAIGAVILYAGANVVYHIVLPRLRSAESVA